MLSNSEPVAAKAETESVETAEEFGELTPMEILATESLAARYRLGETCWTFDPKTLSAIKRLENRNYVTWKHDSYGNILVWLTDLGRKKLLSYKYIPPIAKDSKKVTKRAKAIYKAARKLTVFKS